jgi:FkbM family methyltransferase
MAQTGGPQALFKSLVNTLLAASGNWRICSATPRGRFFFSDIKRFMVPQATVFDVGANRGQWCGEFLANFPTAEKVFCFEPMPTEFEHLLINSRQDSRINCYTYALSSANSQSLLYQGVHPTTNSLSREWAGQPSFAVELITLDDFCARLNVERIHLLKIDTEGHDLEVLKGAHQLLKQRRVDFVLTEVAFTAASRLALFDQIRAYLEDYGYLLFGVYDQQPAWDGKPALIYANACFIKP